jgi:hypothetical protein
VGKLSTTAASAARAIPGPALQTTDRTDQHILLLTAVEEMAKAP